MADLVRYEIVDRVAIVTIDNPPVNALSPAVWDGIDVAVARAAADPNADAIGLRRETSLAAHRLPLVERAAACMPIVMLVGARNQNHW